VNVKFPVGMVLDLGGFKILMILLLLNVNTALLI
jgi:hypothetical protein